MSRIPAENPRPDRYKGLVLAFVMLLGASSLQGEEPKKSSLDKAKQQYDQSVTAARDKVVKYLEKTIVSLTKKDDLENAVLARDWKQALIAEQTTISERLQDSSKGGGAPVPPAFAGKFSVKKYLAALKSARSKLGSAYDKAMRAYAKKGDLDNALAMKAEKALFLLVTSEGGAGPQRTKSVRQTTKAAAETAKSAPQTTKKEKAASLLLMTKGASGLQAALKAFGLSKRGWRMNKDHITGKCGHLQKFTSEPFKAEEVAFSFKIKAKECHGIIVYVDNVLYQYCRGDKKNTVSRISKANYSRLFPGRIVDKPNEFVEIGFTLKEDIITWYYDGKLIRETDVPVAGGPRTIEVGFTSDKLILQLKDFSLTKK